MAENNKIDISDLYLMIGQREVEKYQLTWQVKQLQQQLHALTTQRKEQEDSVRVTSDTDTNGSQPQPEAETETPVKTVAD